MVKHHDLTDVGTRISALLEEEGSVKRPQIHVAGCVTYRPNQHQRVVNVTVQ